MLLSLFFKSELLHRRAFVLAQDAAREEELEPSKFDYPRDREWEWKGAEVDSEEESGREEQEEVSSEDEAGGSGLQSISALLRGGGRGKERGRGKGRGRGRGWVGSRSMAGVGRGEIGGNMRQEGEGGQRKRGRAAKQPEFLTYSDLSDSTGGEELGGGVGELTTAILDSRQLKFYQIFQRWDI